MIKKNWQKSAGQNAVNALLRVGGAGVSAFVLNKLTSDESTNLKKTLKNISGPVLTVAAVLGDLVFEDEKIRSLCQGMYTFGALKSASVVIPSLSSPMGLRGIDDEDMPAIMQGVEIMNGLGSNEQTTDALPAEIAEITNADANGKVFSEVADYIDEGADAAINVSGLSGDDDDEEPYEPIVNGIEDEDEEDMQGIAEFADSML